MKSYYRPSEVAGVGWGVGAISDRERVVGKYPYRNRRSKTTRRCKASEMNLVAATSKSSCELTESNTMFNLQTFAEK